MSEGEFSKHCAIDDRNIPGFLTESLKTPGTGIDPFHRDRFEEHHPAWKVQIFRGLLGSRRDLIIWKSIDLSYRFSGETQQFHDSVCDAPALFNACLF